MSATTPHTIGRISKSIERRAHIQHNIFIYSISRVGLYSPLSAIIGFSFSLVFLCVCVWRVVWRRYHFVTWIQPIAHLKLRWLSGSINHHSPITNKQRTQSYIKYTYTVYDKRSRQDQDADPVSSKQNKKVSRVRSMELLHGQKVNYLPNLSISPHSFFLSLSLSVEIKKCWWQMTSRYKQRELL